MMILHRLYSFNVDDDDEEMVNIYILYIRSILEQSCQVWHYSINQEEVMDLERVQKAACKVILNFRYTDYSQALKLLHLDTLTDRRNTLCLKFAKGCLKHEQTKNMFPLNKSDNPNIRLKEKYHVQHAKRGRLLNSSIPQLQRALNNDVQKKL